MQKRGAYEISIAGVEWDVNSKSIVLDRFAGKKHPLKGIEAVAAKAAYSLLMHCWR